MNKIAGPLGPLLKKSAYLFELLFTMVYNNTVAEMLHLSLT